jgi:hypothetical protein
MQNAGIGKDVFGGIQDWYFEARVSADRRKCALEDRGSVRKDAVGRLIDEKLS